MHVKDAIGTETNSGVTGGLCQRWKNLAEGGPLANTQKKS